MTPAARRERDARITARFGSNVVAVLPDIARGLRAAVVTLVPYYLARKLALPELAWTALAGWLGTLADPGGARGTRARTLLAFGVLGALALLAAESVAPWPWLAGALLVVVTFGGAMARARTATAGSIGLMVTLVVAIAGSRARTTPSRDAVFFAIGAAQALLLSSVVWPVWTHLHVRRAIAGVYLELAAYAREVGALEAAGVSDDAAWAELVRRRHRAVREAIEAAREAATSSRARRDGETRFGSNLRALLGAAEAEFPLLATFVQELAAAAPPARACAPRLLPRLERDYDTVARVLLTRWIRARAPGLVPKDDPLGGGGTVEARLEFGARAARALSLSLDDPHDALAAAFAAPGLSVPPPPRRLFDDLADAFSPRSPILHYALRLASAAAVAAALGALLSPTRSYWVTLTTIVIVQPHVGATVTRAFERVIGTVLGSLVAAAIMVTVRSPLVLSALLVPLSVAAVATRPRSYRLFTVFLTPVFVLLAERFTGDLWTAAARAGDAAIGGGIALVWGVLLLPSSERARVPDALKAMLDALEAYAHAVLGREPEARVAEARRTLGIRATAADASLERLLAEPRHDRPLATVAMLTVSHGRRLATSLTAAHTLGYADADVERYVVAVVAAARARLDGVPPTVDPVPPSAVGSPPLERVVLGAALLESAR